MTIQCRNLHASPVNNDLEQIIRNSRVATTDSTLRMDAEFPSQFVRILRADVL